MFSIISFISVCFAIRLRLRLPHIQDVANRARGFYRHKFIKIPRPGNRSPMEKTPSPEYFIGIFRWFSSVDAHSSDPFYNSALLRFSPFKNRPSFSALRHIDLTLIIAVFAPSHIHSRPAIRTVFCIFRHINTRIFVANTAFPIVTKPNMAKNPLSLLAMNACPVLFQPFSALVGRWRAHDDTALGAIPTSFCKT